MISYLIYVKESKENLHMVIGNELTEEMFQAHNSLIANVLIVNMMDKNDSAGPLCG